MDNELDQKIELICQVLKSTLKEFDLFIGFEINTKSLLFTDRKAYLEGRKDSVRLVRLDQFNEI